MYGNRCILRVEKEKSWEKVLSGIGSSDLPGYEKDYIRESTGCLKK